MKETKKIASTAADKSARQPDERSKEVIFKNYAPFMDCISEVNNTQLDNAKDLDAVMSMYNLIEYSDYYSKISGRF